MKKKFLSILLCSAMAASLLVGCGGSEPAETTEATEAAKEETEAAEAAGDLTFGAMIYKYDDTYISTVRTAIETYADGKAEVIMNDGKGDQATQNDQVDTMISKGVDVLLVNMVDATAAQTVVDKAKAADIPVVFFNREPDAAVISSYDKAIFIGTNAADAGVMQGELMIDIWGDGSTYDLNKDGTCQYLMFQGEPDNPEAIARTEESINTAVAKGLPCELVGGEICIANWDAAQAQQQMEAKLAALDGQVEFVVCNNDGMAEGVVAALNAAGYNMGGDSQMIPVIGVDATDTGLQLIADGKMNATVKQDGDAMGKAIVEIAVNAAAGAGVADFVNGTDYALDDTGVAVRIPYSKVAE